MHDITPKLAERAGGFWLSWNVWPHAVGVHCEICGRALPDVYGFRAHIEERKSEKDDTLENVIVACNDCHDHDKYPDGGLKCGTERAKEIARRK